MSARLSAYISAAPIGRVFVKFYTRACTKILGETPNFVKIGQKFRALHEDLSTFCIISTEV
jgi:hypothetical protein